MGWMLLLLLALPGQVMERQEAPLPLRSWLGVWRDGGNVLRITREGAGIRVVGEAIWQGYGDNMHEGAFNGATQAGTRQVVVDDVDMPGDCRLALLRLGDTLVAADPGQSSCGGVNVTFTGTYRRE